LDNEQLPNMLSPEDSDPLDFLRSQIDDLCLKIVTKFNLYDSTGRPRNAFVLNALTKYSCIGCLVNTFTQPYKWVDVDAIYKENHRLAVNLLTEQLQYRLGKEGFNSVVQDEVEGDYGRVDVLIRQISCGVLLTYNGAQFIVEVKTGKGLSYDQIFRYLIDWPNATLIVWRVIMRQIITLDQKAVSPFLLTYLETILQRGTRLLNGDKITPCNHNYTNEKPYVIRDPQGLINEFLLVLTETLPNIIDTIVQQLKDINSDG